MRVISYRLERLKKLLTKVFGTAIAQKIVVFLLPLLKALRPFYRKFNFYFEGRIAPFIAKNMPWLLWPAYKLLSAFNICFVVNVADGTGHIIPELDNFFRKLYLREIDRNKRYVFIRKESLFSPACVKLYKHKFWWAVCSDFIYHLVLPITIRYKDILLDSGFSRSKWQLDANGNYFIPPEGYTFLHIIDKPQALRQCDKWFERRIKTNDYYPLKEADFDYSEVRRFLRGDTDKLALIHIKTEVMNATAKAVDPQTYMDALAHLSDAGYRLVFMGREKMPEVFKKLGVVNYSESIIASFGNDLALFNMAKITVTGAGGIGYLAACMDTPNLYLNSWHIKSAGMSRISVCVPALIRIKGSDEYMKYPEQNELYVGTRDEDGPEIFPEDRFEARNASSEEILEAIKELIVLIKSNNLEWTLMQKRFGDLINTDMRVSNYFLKKWVKLFP